MLLQTLHDLPSGQMRFNPFWITLLQEMVVRLLSSKRQEMMLLGAECEISVLTNVLH